MLTEYTLHIRLAEIEPPIWRRIVVPGQLTLRQLHQIFQVTVGWTHSHLHQFEVPESKGGTTYYGEPSAEDNYFHADDQLISLAQTAPKKGATFIYTYDFGDNWHHIVTVESRKAATPENPSYPWCIGGQRAAPPEDVGGVQGYVEFLQAWGDQHHPDHRRMRQWVGTYYQPELFSVQQANAALAFFISISNK